VLFAANFLYDKWFAKLGSLARKYLSKFMSWFNKKKMNEQDLDSEELIEEIENEFAAMRQTFASHLVNFTVKEFVARFSSALES
jgi:hypothetical protein